MFPVHPVSLVAHHWKFATSRLHHRADRAHRDHPDPLVQLVTLVHPDPTANPALLEKMVETDHLAQLDPQAQPALPATMVQKAQPATPLSQFQQLLVKTAQLVKMVHLVPLAQMVNPVPMEALAQLVPKVHPALLAHPATMVLQETKDPLVQMDPLEKRVFARNTAPPMVVSSSKTEQGDKHTPPRLCISDEKPVFSLPIFAFIIIMFNGQTHHHSSSTTSFSVF